MTRIKFLSCKALYHLSDAVIGELVRRLACEYGIEDAQDAGQQTAYEGPLDHLEVSKDQDDEHKHIDPF